MPMKRIMGGWKGYFRIFFGFSKDVGRGILRMSYIIFLIEILLDIFIFYFMLLLLHLS